MDKILSQYFLDILSELGARNVDSVEKIQSLWSGYGAIYRFHLNGGNQPSVIIKFIDLSEQVSHPRGWAGEKSHQRKLRSYQVEQKWYQQYAENLPEDVKVPTLLYSKQAGDIQILVLEDLSIAFPELKRHCTFDDAKSVISWLAQFHACFMNLIPEGLWETGTYWHLDTRPDEWKAMAESDLKTHAQKLDELLRQARFQTFVHGDAKVANFCFGNDGRVAAVDFQYIGGGVGVKDLAYFLGSCFTDEECSLYEAALLDFYFEELRMACASEIDAAALEVEWRLLYPVAWADFNRFLMGWLPTHYKLHSHALSKNAIAFGLIK